MAKRFVIPVWRGVPAWRPFVLLALGIYGQWQLALPLSFLWLLTGFSLIPAILISLLPVTHRYQWRSVAGVLLSITILSGGALLVWYKHPLHQPDALSTHYTGKEVLEIVLEEATQSKAHSWKAKATITRVLTHNRVWPVQAGVWLYFAKDSGFQGLPAGSRIITAAIAQPVAAPLNPGMFDYQRYSLFNGITHQLHLAAGSFVIVPGNYLKPVPRWLSSWRSRIVHIIDTYITGSREAGLAEALLIGYKNNLDQELVQSYTNTGIVHIIAISGLHLGLIYWLLRKACNWLPRHRHWKWISPVLQTGGLWIFSLLAGAQPSVLRSAVMFTLIILGDVLLRKSSIYNSLALAALLLLCYNPFWLWDLGFQLSFLAVASLVIFMKPVYQLLYFKTWLADAIWKTCAVTLAAQLLTLPVCLFQFHQFPNYFLIANLLIVPLSSIILIGEILLCLLSLLPAAAAVLGKLLNWLIWLMNETVKLMEQLPYAITRQIYFPEAAAWTLLALLCMLALACTHKKREYAWLTAVCSCMFWMVMQFYSWQRSRQQVLIVYHTPRQVIIDFMAGHRYRSWPDTVPAGSNNFYVQGSRLLYGVSRAETLPALVINGSLIQWQHQRIWIASQPVKDTATLRYPVDLLLLCHRADSSVLDWVYPDRLKWIVACPTLSNRALQQWQSICRRRQLPFYAVKTNGAFVMKQR